MHPVSARMLFLLSSLALLSQGCGTIWHIPETQTVRFLGKPEGMNVTVVNAKTRDVYARVKTPASVTFASSPWRMLRRHEYLCTFEADGYVSYTAPLNCRIPNGMYLLWTAGFPIGLVGGCVDSLCGSGSCRFQKEVKIRLRKQHPSSP